VLLLSALASTSAFRLSLATPTRVPSLCRQCRVIAVEGQVDQPPTAAVVAEETEETASNAEMMPTIEAPQAESEPLQVATATLTSSDASESGVSPVAIGAGLIVVMAALALSGGAIGQLLGGQSSAPPPVASKPTPVVSPAPVASPTPPAPSPAAAPAEPKQAVPELTRAERLQSAKAALQQASVDYERSVDDYRTKTRGQEPLVAE